MKKWFLLFAGIAALATFAPAASLAQGIGIDVPGVGVRIGEPYRYRDWDSPRVYREPRFHERDVVLHRGLYELQNLFELQIGRQRFKPNRHITRHLIGRRERRGRSRDCYPLARGSVISEL